MPKIVVLFGNRRNEISSHEDELTLDDRRYVWSTSLQVLNIIKEGNINNAIFLRSTVLQVAQSAYIALAAFGLYSKGCDILPELEEESGSSDVIKTMVNAPSDIVFAFGHNDLLQKIAQELCPKSEGYEIGLHEALIFKSDDGPNGNWIQTVAP